MISVFPLVCLSFSLPFPSYRIELEFQLHLFFAPFLLILLCQWSSLSFKGRFHRLNCRRRHRFRRRRHRQRRRRRRRQRRRRCHRQRRRRHRRLPYLFTFPWGRLGPTQGPFPLFLFAYSMLHVGSFSGV